MSSSNKWWGGLHETGGVILIPNSNLEGINRAEQRDDVVYTVSPIYADSVDSAIRVFNLATKEVAVKRHTTVDQWWAFEHNTSGVHVKRFYNREEMTNRKCSQFIKRVVGPYTATSRAEAEKIAKKKIGKEEVILHGKAKSIHRSSTTTSG